MDWMRGAASRLAPGLSSFYPGDMTARSEQLRLASIAGRSAKPAELYAMLRSYYNSNSLYQNLARGLYEAGIAHPAMRALRNPAYRVVEFYVAALWPGQLPDALPIQTENERIVDPIRQVWTWSNWGSQKQVFARWLPMLGDVFVKVVPDLGRGRVYFQLVDPAHVVDFDTDERGYLTYVRIDVSVQRRRGDLVRALTHTEVWSRDLGTFRRWEHDRGDRPVEELGEPLEETPLRAFGIDFVPIVHCMHHDVGEARGVGSFTLQLDKIDEAARKATRLGQMLFRNAGGVWAVEGQGQDASNRPLPPLRVGTDGTADGSVSVRMGDEVMMSLPGGYTVKSLVPDIDYAAMLAALNADLLELQADLPEMSYWRIPEAGGNLSGRALRTLLAPALTRADEARGNAFDALARADAMALTIGVAAGLFDRGIGSYEAGSFVHSFTAQDVIPADAFEEAQTAVQSWTAAKLQKDAGVSTDAVLAERGYSEEDIAAFEQEREADQSALDEAVGALLDRQPGATVPVVPANGRPANGQVPPNGNGGSGAG